MTKTITTALMIALSTTGCIAYAHPPITPPVQDNHAVRHHPRASYPHAVHEVRAWVWVNGHYSRNGMWTHGRWEIQMVYRNLLSSHPRTHIRWIEGRNRPAARPHRRHRRNRR